MHRIELGWEPNESKVGLKARTLDAFTASRFRPWSESNASNESKVGPQARTLGSLDPFDSDPGPNLMNRMHLKSGPRPGLESHSIHVAHSSHSMQRQLKLAWGVCSQCPCATRNALDSDLGPNLMNLNESKHGPQGVRFRLPQAIPGPLH